MKAAFDSRANREVRSIAEYYTSEAGAQHAQDFLDDLEAVVNRIKLWPRSFPSIDGEIRRAILRNYPFIVVYEIESEDLLRILAVRHQKQDPDIGLVS